MPKCNLTWYQPKVRRIMKDIKGVKQSQIARVLCITPQGVSNNMRRDTYEHQLIDLIQILDLAGYEIKEKEGEY